MFRVALASLALVLSGGLAGCLSDGGSAGEEGETAGAGAGPIPVALRAPLTEPVFEILGHFDHSWQSTTGNWLYVDYYRPDVPVELKVPVILTYTPYQDTSPGEATGGLVAEDTPYNAGLVNFYVPRGYAVAFADVQGNHRASGCVDQTGPLQWQDGYEYVQWLGSQEWSNGRVGMYGISYDGETQFTTAMMAPSHLVTIVPTASVSNQYEWNFYQGVPYELQPLVGMAAYFAGSAVPSADPDALQRYGEKLRCQPQMFGAALDTSGDYTEVWQERDYRPMAGQIEASVLHIHGLADWNVRPINIDPLFNDINSTKRAIFGQWQHQFPERSDWEFLLHAWYDYWLMERENGILDILPPVLIEDSQERWWGMEEFPPRDQEWVTLELSADGRLVGPGRAEEGILSIHDIPQEYYGDPSLGLASASETVAGAMGEATELVFEITAEVDLRLVGRPYVTFTADSSARSTHWAALLEVGGEDCGGAVICQNAGYQDTRHRNGLDQPSDVSPGVPYDLTIEMFPQYDVIPAGSILRLVLTNNSPDIQQDPTNSVNRVHLGGETPAILHLPLDPGGIELSADSLPDVYPG